MFENFLDLEPKTKHGIDKLDIMIHLIPVINTKPGKAKTGYNQFKSFLVEKLKRGITTLEEIALAQAILNYIQSDAKTNERFHAIKCLSELDFLGY